MVAPTSLVLKPTVARRDELLPDGKSTPSPRKKRRRFGRSMIRPLEDLLNHLSIGEERQVIP
jgi:urease accessory protein UreF